MDEFDKFMKKKYEEVEVPNSIGKNIPFREKKKNNYIVLKVAASVIALFILVGAVYLYVNKNTSSLKTEDNLIAENNELPVADEEVYLNLKFDERLYTETSPDYIMIIELKAIVEYTNFSEKLNKYFKLPITKLSIDNKKMIKGINSIENMYIHGGIISRYDFEKSLITEREKNEYVKEMSEDEKKSTFVKITTLNTLEQAEPVLNKTYLVCLIQDSVYDGYICYSKYGFVEYDTETGMVKNVDTGEWEEIDKSILDLDNLR